MRKSAVIAFLIVLFLTGLACAKANELLTPTASNPATQSLVQPTIGPSKVIPTETPAATASPAVTSLTCRVTTGVPVGWLNLRAGPGIEYSVISVLAEGQLLEVIGTIPSWIQVETPSGTGWIYSAYCEVEK